LFDGRKYAVFFFGPNRSVGLAAALTVHALGTALVVGFILIICLRLLGWFTLIPYTSLNRCFRDLGLRSCCKILSGFTLWMAKPAQYVADGGVHAQSSH